MDEIAQQCFRIVKRDDGVTFYDMSPLLASAALRRQVTNELHANTLHCGATHVLGLETRGYIVGAWLADALGTPFIRVPKLTSALKSHSADELVTQSYDLEYKKGEAIALPKNAIPPHARVLIVDDVYVTGGTMKAAAELVYKVEPTAHVVGKVVVLRMGKPDGAVQFVFTTDAQGKVCWEDIPELLETSSSGIRQLRVPLIHDKRAVVMWHPSMERLALHLIAANPQHLRASEISWKSFPDGWPNVHFEDCNTLEGRHVVFLASFHDKRLIMEQISMMIALPRQGIKSLRVFIPYYASGTMERVSVEGELATAETLAKLLSATLPATRQGPPIITIFDIHALPERFYFDDRAQIKFATALPLIKKKILEQKMTVVFPDEGAFKRFYLEFKGTCPIIVCSKMRGTGDERSIRVSQIYGEVDEEKPWIIVDDLVQSGSTLAETARALRQLYPKVKEINAYVTHAVFPDHAYRRFLKSGDRDVFHRFYVTNTNPEVAKLLVAVGSPFEVLDIVPLMGETLVSCFKSSNSSNAFNAGESYDDMVLAGERSVHPSIPSQHNVTIQAGGSITAMPKIHPITKIVILSESPVKRRAVERALAQLNWKLDVSTLKANSGVPKQPVGLNKMRQGALSRLGSVSEPQTGTLYLAIESGIYRAGSGHWCEASYVLFATKDSGCHSITRGVLLPTPVFENYLQRVLDAKGTVTIGELIHADDPTIPADEWYDRVFDISNALVKGFATFMS